MTNESCQHSQCASPPSVYRLHHLAALLLMVPQFIIWTSSTVVICLYQLSTGNVMEMLLRMKYLCIANTFIIIQQQRLAPILVEDAVFRTNINTVKEKSKYLWVSTSWWRCWHPDCNSRCKLSVQTATMSTTTINKSHKASVSQAKCDWCEMTNQLVTIMQW